MSDPLFDDWHVVARSADLKEGEVLSARLLGEDLVVWRSGGRALVWQDLCVHRGTRLSMGFVKDCALICPYHGWHYNAEGKCFLMPAHPDQPPPARAKAITYPVKEAYGFIWASLSAPERDVPPFPEFEDAQFRKVHAGPYHFQASGFRAVENFVDASHFPYVHGGFNGDPNAPDTIDDYEVEVTREGLRTSPVKVRQLYADARGVSTVAAYTYHV